MLQPSTNLMKLTIDLYGGTSFPSWLGDSSFSNMVHLGISNCHYCITLPPLGQLPSLKDLRINGMTILETIGPEFYSLAVSGLASSFQPFPSLETLEFGSMPSWKEWLPFEGNQFPFPRLETLRLSSCPELRGHLPCHLSSLEQIRISCCDRLMATPPTLHWLLTIKKLVIEGNSDSEGSTESTQWALFGSESPCLLQHVSIIHCGILMALPKMILTTTCLQQLTLKDVPSLTAFPEDGLPTSLQSLRILECGNLAFLPQETWSNYTSLVTLELHNSCDALTSFPLDGFPMLQHLDIGGCRSLESIFISESCSPHRSTLQSLCVSSCKALRSLPQRMYTLTTLEDLALRNLPELELSFCEEACLPPKLQNIVIPPVRITTPISEWGIQRLTTLSQLTIGGNDNVKSLMKERLLPISLVSLTITDLSEMKSLSGNGLQHLSSLEKLKFQDCSGLECLVGDMLPSSLENLEFSNCPRLESLPEDRLPSSLKLLRIRQCPLLKARYESKRGEHWSNIAHIPVIQINSKMTI